MDRVKKVKLEVVQRYYQKLMVATGSYDILEAVVG